LVLSKDLCAMLETGEFSYPAGIEEAMNVQLSNPQPAGLENKPSPNEKH
jgi:hypothetical protein